MSTDNYESRILNPKFFLDNCYVDVVGGGGGLHVPIPMNSRAMLDGWSLGSWQGMATIARQI